MSRVLRAVFTAAAMLGVLLAPRTAEAQQRVLAGTYKFTINSPQGVIESVIKLEGPSNTALQGTLDATGFPTIPIVKVTPTDSGFLAEADAGGESVVVRAVLLPADRMRGTLTYQGMEMPIDGTVASAAAVNPVGRYVGKTLDAFMGASEFPFQCVITKTNERFGGGCAPGGDDVSAAPIEAVTVNGREIVLTGSSQAGPYTAKLTVTGATFTGTLSLGGETARIQGTVAAPTASAR